MGMAVTALHWQGQSGEGDLWTIDEGPGLLRIGNVAEGRSVSMSIVEGCVGGGVGGIGPRGGAVLVCDPPPPGF